MEKDSKIWNNYKKGVLKACFFNAEAFFYYFQLHIKEH